MHLRFNRTGNFSLRESRLLFVDGTPEAPPPTIQQLRSLDARMVTVQQNLTLRNSTDPQVLLDRARSRVDAAETNATAAHERVRGAVQRIASREFTAHTTGIGMYAPSLHGPINRTGALDAINQAFNGVAVFRLNDAQTDVVLDRLVFPAPAPAPAPTPVPPGPRVAPTATPTSTPSPAPVRTETASLNPRLQPFQNQLDQFTQVYLAAGLSQRQQMLMNAQYGMMNTPYAVTVIGGYPALYPRFAGWPILRPRIAVPTESPTGAPTGAPTAAPTGGPGGAPGGAPREGVAPAPPSGAQLDTFLRSTHQNLNVFQTRYRAAAPADRPTMITQAQAVLDSRTPPGYPRYTFTVAGDTVSLTPPAASGMPILAGGAPLITRETEQRDPERGTPADAVIRRVTTLTVSYTRNGIDYSRALQMATDMVNQENMRTGSPLRARIRNLDTYVVNLNYGAGSPPPALVGTTNRFAPPPPSPGIDTAVARARTAPGTTRQQLGSSHLQMMGWRLPNAEATNPVPLTGDSITQSANRSAGALQFVMLGTRNSIDERGRVSNTELNGQLQTALNNFNAHPGNLVTLEIRAVPSRTSSTQVEQNLYIRPKPGISFTDLRDCLRGIAAPLMNGEALLIQDIGRSRNTQFFQDITNALQNVASLTKERARGEALLAYRDANTYSLSVMGGLTILRPGYSYSQTLRTALAQLDATTRDTNATYDQILEKTNAVRTARTELQTMVTLSNDASALYRDANAYYNRANPLARYGTPASTMSENLRASLFQLWLVSGDGTPTARGDGTISIWNLQQAVNAVRTAQTALRGQPGMPA